MTGTGESWAGPAAVGVRAWALCGAALALVSLSGAATASDSGIYDVQRAHFNYQMFCQGCHTPDGSGARHVPRMKDHVGRFTTTVTGRDYLVRVPGSATSSLDDAELAEVLNWIVSEFSGASANAGFEPYTAAEVAELRRKPLNEVARYRVDLLADIAGHEARE